MPVHLGEVGVGGMPEVNPVVVELQTTPRSQNPRPRETWEKRRVVRGRKDDTW